MKLGANINSFVHVNSFTVIEAAGKDAGDFLHRMSTNNVVDLKIGETCLSTFLNQKGRLISLCYLMRRGANSYLLVVPYESDAPLADWLDQYLFSEDATLTDQSDQFEIIWQMGDSEAGFSGPELSTSSGPIKSRIILTERSKINDCDSKLEADGANLIEQNQFEALRIAGLCPYAKNEININYHPIQLGLMEAISWTKGCYIGQEVISRLESKSKTASTLFGMKVSKENWGKLVEGETILLDSKPAGTLTSKAPIYLDDQANALFVLKREHEKGKLMTDLSKICIDSHHQAD